ncbi:SLC35A2 [Cordylochernes scorpioides]|uniref:SLC35A2 n=1 Tax=Cordylochernes scorpioides TaxID=51811 RepID=A0ABY6KLP3_9ARAC|nr:SLC35A2 [Cordylochernes scorpioides]
MTPLPKEHFDCANNLCVTTQRVHAGGQSLAKYGSLVCLTLQNAALSLLMRLSRTQHELFAATTAVVAAEVLKLAVCLALLFVEEQMGKGVNLGRLLVHTIVKQPMDTLRVMIPAIVYTIQNTLIYLGATHLDAATYQVTYQLKILTTALLSVAMLNKRLSRLQWLSLVLLFMGIALVQLTQISGPATAVAGHEQKPLIGFLAVFGACCLSGFAGVYFEKILKGSDVSLWMRNVQMALFSVPVGLVGVVLYDGQSVQEHGFFYGYTLLTWLVIALQALGGLMVAMVVKHADNILKGFATSLAIVIACVVSLLFLDFHLTPVFTLGSTMVIGSIFLYSQPTAPVPALSSPDKR